MERALEIKNRFKPDQGYAFHTEGEDLFNSTPLFYGLSKEDINNLIEIIVEQHREIDRLKDDNERLENLVETVTLANQGMAEKAEQLQQEISRYEQAIESRKVCDKCNAEIIKAIGNRR